MANGKENQEQPKPDNEQPSNPVPTVPQPEPHRRDGEPPEKKSDVAS
jgi:hypothetical protein